MIHIIHTDHTYTECHRNLLQSTSPKSTLHKWNYRLSRIFLTVPICSVYFQWYVFELFLISRSCNSNFAYLEYILGPQGDQTCVHLPKSKWPQLSFLTDFIRVTFNPCCQLDQKDVINIVMRLSAFISLYLYPEHTNVYKTVTLILSKSK